MKKASLRDDFIETLSLDDLCRFCRADEAWVTDLVEERRRILQELARSNVI